MVSPLGSVAEQIVESLVGVRDLLGSAMFGVGILLVLRGVLKFTAFNQDPTKNRLSESTRLVLLGLFSINMPAVLNMVWETTQLTPPSSQVASVTEVPAVLAASTEDPPPLGTVTASPVDSAENGARGAAQWTTERSIK